MLTGISIVWAIEPSVAWIEGNRTLTAVAVLASGIALVRMVPDRWRALIGGVLVASLIVSGYALLTKIFPAWLASDETYGRLREPFEYWNAVGLMAALGLPPAVWLGARRDGHAGLAALAYPATGVLVLTILLAYSRGSLLAAGVGLGLWFIVAPLRLRSAIVLLPSFVLGAIAAWWAFGQEGLSKDQIPLAIRSNAGTELGVLVCVLDRAAAAGGLRGELAARPARVVARDAAHLGHRAADRRSCSCRSRWPAGLATTDRGLGGSISHGWRSLTDPNANTPSNDPSRLTAIGSVRARYWRDAIEVFKARPARRRRRGRLPARAAALPQGRPRRAARARLPRADGRQPRHRRPGADARAAGRVARGDDPHDRAVARAGCARRGRRAPRAC